MKEKLYIISALLLLAIITGPLTGCSRSCTETLTDTASQIQGMENYKPSGELAIAFSNDIIYEVMEISWDGDSGIAEVKVTAPDLERIISDSIEKEANTHGAEDYNALLEAVKKNICHTLTSKRFPTSVNTIEMDAKKDRSGYILISNDEFFKIVSGNLEEIYVRALLEGFVNEK